MKRWIVAGTAVFLGLALAACGSGSGDRVLLPQAEPAESAKEPAAPETAETESAQEGAENLGPFTVETKESVLELPMFGISIELPKDAAGEESVFGASGYVDTDMGYADIYLLEGSGEEAAAYVLTEIIGSREDLYETVSGQDLGYAAEPLGENETYHYFGYRFDRIREQTPAALEDMTRGLTEEQESRYNACLELSGDILGGITVGGLVLPEKVIPSLPIEGLVLSDLEGEEVHVDELVAANKVTMLNIWGTFCGPCINEMPDLGDLAREYADRGFSIVGLTCDTMDYSGTLFTDKVEKAKTIVADTGVTYPVLIMDSNLLMQMNVEAVPTTYFVDAQGKQIGEPYVGSRSREAWAEIIESLLEARE